MSATTEHVTTPTVPASATTPPAAEPFPEPDPRRWRMLPVILSAMFVAMFEYFVVNVAAPSFQHDLHTSDAGIELVVGGYGFAYAAGLITGGRLGDLLGYKRMFVLGMAAFTVASLACGIATSSAMLIAARLVQGATAAAMVPQLLALINVVYPLHERPRAMAWFGATIGTGSVAGQVLGGVLLEANLFHWTWRPIFLVNVPIGAIAVVLAIRWLPDTRGAQRPRFDPVGAIAIAAAIGLALAPLILGRAEGWPLWTWISMAASVPVLIVALRWESRLGRAGGSPMVDLALFKERTFSIGLALSGLMLAMFGGFMLAMTLFLQGGMHMSPVRAGLLFGPLGVAFAGSSMLARRVSGRFGSRVIAIGAALSTTGLVLLGVVLTWRGTDLAAWQLLPSMMLVGAGNGLVLPSLVGSVLAGIRSRNAGAASGMLVTAQQFGGAAGVTVLGTVFFSALGSHPSGFGDFVTAMRWVDAVDVVTIVAILGLAFLLPKQAAGMAARR
ncbi:MFS transporter [Catenulispora yoronensis]|uniref:MFS transporter n=1 Tax=Catenulispora yoronensis TaxID=450799 RepID=UPI0031D8C310